jgi:hypothetical protein
VPVCACLQSKGHAAVFAEADAEIDAFHHRILFLVLGQQMTCSACKHGKQWMIYASPVTFIVLRSLCIMHIGIRVGL